ncbi:Dihydrolipoamide dehydrogenase [Sterolibacterium denitrificans]|uniref:Dihydrolipoyl dehydrogenase n=1 Tax=Sterolibacterium denitrificans TaxID=157592 RepID=A0A7Z7HU36_9PROT|nr:dihydrolipoyl dehydrogenase [Sterolibacterium denitrificans]SMB32196.1 Dihydrolipoamide dehydrogenase [Sterolibacterium denitrificans]
MSRTIEIKVPDIGDFQAVPVIEVMARPGDAVAAEDSLITLESDKATIDVPSPVAGILRELKVKVGDKVSQGSIIALLEVGDADEVGESGGAGTEAVTSAAVPAPEVPATAAASTPHAAADLLVLGGGPGGYSAAFRAADLGLKVTLVERYPTLGGVCLNVGCIPSKALLHVAAVIDEARGGNEFGVSFGVPKIDLDKLRAHKNGVVGKLTQGLAGMAKVRKVDVIQGTGRFVDGQHLRVTTNEGEKTIAFRQAIIAVGSQSVKLPFVPEDPRIVDATGALALPFVPKRMLVIGGGIIGLEMATVYAALGAQLSIVEMTDGLMPGTDRDLVKVFEKCNAKRFDSIMLKTRVTAVEALPEGIQVSFAGEQAPAGPQRYDMVLVAVGRTPNGKSIGAEAAGVAVDERGYIAVDRQMRTNIPHIYAIGDVVGQPMLAHKAVHEGHVAAEAAAGGKSAFDARVIPAVAYTQPEVAWVGLTESQAGAQGVAVEKGVFPWAASGRAIANGAEYGFTKLLFDRQDGRIVGGAIVGPNAGDMIGEVALAIEMGADAIDVGKTIHPHPTLGETIGLAAEAAHGSCTDLPPARKRKS